MGTQALMMVAAIITAVTTMGTTEKVIQVVYTMDLHPTIITVMIMAAMAMAIAAMSVMVIPVTIPMVHLHRHQQASSI
jgi:hypothetical protein